MSVQARDGARQLAAVGRRLKEAGAGGLRRELLATIRRSAKSAIPDVRASAERTLPSGGGLAALIAGSKIGVRTRLTGRVGVQIRGDSPRSIRAMNRGRLRHPVFGNREVWVTQQVKPGWFTDPLQKRAPAIQRDIRQAMSDIARRIEKGT